MTDPSSPFADRPRWHARCEAALARLGPNAVISHWTALMIHGIVPVDEDAPIHVTSPFSSLSPRHSRTLDGIVHHF